LSLFDIFSILITLAALFSYVNHRYIKLPTTIGLMAIALVMSLILLGTSKLGLIWIEGQAEGILRRVDFYETLMHGMLSFLLFAGALHVDLNDLEKQKWSIGLFATLGTVASTIIVGFASWYVLKAIGFALPLLFCLIFGALISPTDPIAVLGIMKTAGTPRSLETKITGEALFNDGIGVVVFLVLTGIAWGGIEPTPGHIALLFLEEAAGGVAFGLAIGGTAYWMLKQVDNYQVEVLITLALVMGGYALADAMHVSGPIAVVVAGLLIGNHGRRFAMSTRTRDNLDTFWELVDEILNAVLFVLLGLELLLIDFDLRLLCAALACIPIVLVARYLSVSALVATLRPFRKFAPHTVNIMTWAGLRGGISVALALALRPGPERDIIIAMTYVTVVFSILVQGLSVGWIIRRTLPPLHTESS
jgi:CPA1 family monovalent cation:H+ antiporter